MVVRTAPGALAIAASAGCGMLPGVAGCFHLKAPVGEIDDGSVGPDAAVEMPTSDVSPSDPAAESPSGPALDDGNLEIDSSTSGGDGAAFSPVNLLGLVLWLDGEGLRGSMGSSNEDADSSGPAEWIDRSGHGNHGMPTGTPSVRLNAIGGEPAVHFNGTTDYFTFADNPSIQFGKDDFLIAVVAAHMTSTVGTFGYGLLYSKQLPSSPFVGPSFAGNSPTHVATLYAQLWWMEGVQLPPTNFNNGQPFLAIFQRFFSADRSSATLRLHARNGGYGIFTDPSLALDVSAPGAPAFVGGDPKGQDLEGDIAELVAVHGPVPDTDRGRLEMYFRQRYGL
jgi:hypothetical protein